MWVLTAKAAKYSFYQGLFRLFVVRDRKHGQWGRRTVKNRWTSPLYRLKKFKKLQVLFPVQACRQTLKDMKPDLYFLNCLVNTFPLLASKSPWKKRVVLFLCWLGRWVSLNHCSGRVRSDCTYQAGFGVHLIGFWVLWLVGRFSEVQVLNCLPDEWRRIWNNDCFL